MAVRPPKIMVAERENPIKYTPAFPNTTGWTMSGWNLWLFLNTFNENNAHDDGILRNGPWGNEQESEAPLWHHYLGVRCLRSLESNPGWYRVATLACNNAR